jgi:hypothetical protein
MAERLVEQRDAVDRYAVEKKDLDLTLSDDHWAILEEVVKILKPAEEISLQFCKDFMSTFLPFSIMLHRAMNAMKIINEEANKIRKKIVCGLFERFLVFEWDK